MGNLNSKGVHKQATACGVPIQWCFLPEGARHGEVRTVPIDLAVRWALPQQHLRAALRAVRTFLDSVPQALEPVPPAPCRLAGAQAVRELPAWRWRRRASDELPARASAPHRQTRGRTPEAEESEEEVRGGG